MTIRIFFVNIVYGQIIHLISQDEQLYYQNTFLAFSRRGLSLELPSLAKSVKIFNHHTLKTSDKKLACDYGNPIPPMTLYAFGSVSLGDNNDV